MKPTIGDPVPTKGRYLIATITAVLSLLLPGCIGLICVVAALTFNPLGRTSEYLAVRSGIVLDGEVISVAMGVSDALPSAAVRLKHLNLATGIEYDAEVIQCPGYCHKIWLDGELYGYDLTAICRRVGSNMVITAAQPAIERGLRTAPFLYDGQLTIVIETDKDEVQLVHLVEGKWKEGRKIVLPRRGALWRTAENGQQRLFSPSSFMLSRGTGPLILQVIPWNNEFHLFMKDTREEFAAYRCGFEFADDQDNSTSADSPADSLQEMPGWEAIQGSGTGEIWSGMACDRDGLLFCSRSQRGQIVRRTFDGQWLPVLNKETIVGPSSLIADPDEKKVYAAPFGQSWDHAVIYRVDGDHLHPINLTSPRRKLAYHIRSLALLVAISFAVFLHPFILIIGERWLDQPALRADYRVGLKQAQLASISRRGFAFAFDLILMTILVSILISLEMNRFGWLFQRKYSGDFTDTVFRIEKTFVDCLNAGLFIPNRQNLFNFANGLLGLIVGEWAWGMLVVANTIVVLCLKFWIESRWGITPGKYLFGIRAVTSQLQPTGLAKVISRNVLYWVDVPFLITPLPASVSMILSPCRQRLGDRIADTLVIRHGSIRDCDARTEITRTTVELQPDAALQ